MSLIQFLFGFHGRIRRLHLWLYLLAVMVIHGGLWWQFGHILSVPHHVDMMMDSGVDMRMDHMSGFRVVTHNPFVGLAELILAWTHLAVFVKRWHDRNKSGWWMQPDPGHRPVVDPDRMRLPGWHRRSEHLWPRPERPLIAFDRRVREWFRGPVGFEGRGSACSRPCSAPRGGCGGAIGGYGPSA